MTLEEAIEWMRNFQNNVVMCCDDKEKVGDAISATMKSIESMEKHIKYAWHDLRKNPNDLPKVGERIIFVIYDNGEIDTHYSGTFYGGSKKSFDEIEPYFENDDAEQYCTKGWYRTHEVKAWRYMEMFES